MKRSLVYYLYKYDGPVSVIYRKTIVPLMKRLGFFGLWLKWHDLTCPECQEKFICPNCYAEHYSFEHEGEAPPPVEIKTRLEKVMWNRMLTRAQKIKVCKLRNVPGKA